MTPQVRAALRSLDLQFDAVRAMPEPIASTERYRHGIEQVGNGAYIRLKGRVYRVQEVSEYREKRSRWYGLELFGIGNGEVRYLEWEKDDKVEVSFSDPPHSLRDIGKTSDEIEAMSEEERGRIDFGGHSYYYDDDYGATYHRGGREDSEKLYLYEFETEDGRYGLTVEEWGDDGDGFEYEVYTSESIDPDEIEILVVGEGAPR
jgi:hypothetical protein